MALRRNRSRTSASDFATLAARFAEAQALAKAGSWELDLATGQLWWSDETYRIFEIEPDRFGASYEAFLALVHPDDRVDVDAAYTSSVRDRVPYDTLHRLLLSDGRIKHVRELGRTEYAADGTALRTVGSVQDVTEWRVLHSRALDDAYRSRALVSGVADVVAIVGTDGALSYVNEAFERSLGFQGADWIGRPVLDVIWPTDVSEAAGLISVAMAVPESVTPWLLRIRHADGGCRWFEGTAVNHLGDVRVAGLLVTCRDVTERIQREAVHQIAQERMVQAVAIAGVGIFDHDHGTNSVYWSRELQDMYGVNDSAPSFEQYVSMIHPEDRTRVLGMLAQAYDPASDGELHIEHRIVRTDGAVRMLVARSRTYFGGDGAARRPLRTVGAVIDETEMRGTAEALRLAQQAVDATLSGISIADAEGKIIFANPAFARMWGFDSPGDALGKRPTELAEAISTADFLKTLQETGRGQTELRAIRRDGSQFDILVAASAMRDSDGNISHLVGAFADLTESKKLQQQLQQAQKMESVGRLAGGVAHDFNNLLTVISGHLDLAIDSLPAADPIRRELQVARAAAESAAGVTRQLLAYSRKQVIQPTVLDLDDAIRNVTRMLQRLIGEHIEMRVIPGQDLARVRFDRAQLEQILVNLVVNARDAMPEGGRLTVETANLSLDDEYARLHPGVDAGDYVMLAVSDTGIGMTDDVRAHAFEPFFTTKEVGRGTGLGLPVVFGTVAQNGGRMEIYSEVGHGTTVKVYLPAILDAPTAIRKPLHAEKHSGRETIVLVEDDADVRNLASLVLRRHGYVVHEFENGPSAIDAVAGMSEDVHLLVTDVVMPGMNGREVADHLGALRPEIRVLFTSGYTENVIMVHGTVKPGVEFLAKPYTVAGLGRRVREVLDGRPAEPPVR